MPQPGHRTSINLPREDRYDVRNQIRVIPVLVGGAGGFLLSAIGAILCWAGLRLAGAGENAVTGGIVLGVILGTFGGGFLAGNADPRSVFHGSLTGILLASGITIVALGEGSPAAVLVQAGFLIGAGVIGGLGGWAADLRRQRKRRRNIVDQGDVEGSNL